MSERRSHTEDNEPVSLRAHLGAATESVTRELTQGPIGTSLVGSVVATTIVARGSSKWSQTLTTLPDLLAVQVDFQ